MSRPEHTGPPELFYNEREAASYAQSSRMIQIQRVISERAIELLNLPPGKAAFLLDVGCGTGLSGDVISRAGHAWVGLDISQHMLQHAASRLRRSQRLASVRMEDKEEDDDDEEEEEEDDDGGSSDDDASGERGPGDVAVSDMGQGLPFRGGVFDGAISISAVQWLCYANHRSHVPRQRLKRFFQQLYNSLRRGARAVLQLYPETPQQMEMITNAAMQVGFTGGLVVDYPNSAKAKKYYLCLFAGVAPAGERAPKALGAEEEYGEGARYEKRRKFDHRGKRRGNGGGKRSGREWVKNKKERQRKQGKNVRPDTKYTGRKRKARW